MHWRVCVCWTGDVLEGCVLDGGCVGVDGCVGGCVCVREGWMCCRSGGECVSLRVDLLSDG